MANNNRPSGVERFDEDFDRGPDDVASGSRRLFDARLDSSAARRRRRNNSDNRETQAAADPSSSDANTPTRERQPAEEGTSGVRKIDFNDNNNSPSDYNLVSMENLVNEIQKTYFDITGLEDKCERLFAGIQQQGGEATSEDEWNNLYYKQSLLLQKYYDFLFLTNHPYGNYATKSLIKKYKIPLRMWNKGIFKFLDLLRHYREQTYDITSKFTLDCFSLLSMLTDPPYESRNMWLEALGDIARFSMILGPSPTADWKKVAQFWYQKAMVRSPGVGRLYHHSAVVSAHKIDSLFYFCKALSATQPFGPATDTVASLFKSNLPTDNTVPMSVSHFLSLHQSLFDDPHLDSFPHPEILHSFLISIDREKTRSDSNNDELEKADENKASNSNNNNNWDYPDNYLTSRGFAIAVCNISALLDYGANPSNRLWGHFNDDSVSKEESPASLSLALSTLKEFLQLPFEQALPHALVWLVFLDSLTDNDELFNAIVLDSQFPAVDFGVVLKTAYSYVTTEVLKIRYEDLSSKHDLMSRISRWKKTLSEISPRTPDGTETRQSSDLLPRVYYQQKGTSNVGEKPCTIPSFKQRPLPEEIELYGFLWTPKSIIYANHIVDLELSIPDNLFPGFSNSNDVRIMRPVRAVELIHEISDKRGWPSCGPSKFFELAGSEDHVELSVSPPLLHKRPLPSAQSTYISLPQEFRLNFPSVELDYSGVHWVFDLGIWIDCLEEVGESIGHLFKHIDVPLIIIRQLKKCTKATDEDYAVKATRAIDYIVSQHQQGKINIYTTSKRNLLQRNDIVEHASELDSGHPDSSDSFLDFLKLSKIEFDRTEGPNSLIVLTYNDEMVTRVTAENIISVKYSGIH